MWYVVLAAAIFSLGSGWYAHGVYYDAKAAEELRKEKRLREQAEEKADYSDMELLNLKAKLAVLQRQSTKEVIRLVQTPYYSESAPACLDDDGLRSVQSAIAAANSARAASSAGAVPGSGASR